MDSFFWDGTERRVGLRNGIVFFGMEPSGSSRRWIFVLGWNREKGFELSSGWNREKGWFEEWDSFFWDGVLYLCHAIMRKKIKE
jgi:hypothetical protein